MYSLEVNRLFLMYKNLLLQRRPMYNLLLLLLQLKTSSEDLRTICLLLSLLCCNNLQWCDYHLLVSRVFIFYTSFD